MHDSKRKFQHNPAEVDRALRARWRSSAEGAINKHRPIPPGRDTIHLRQKLTAAVAAAIEGLR